MWGEIANHLRLTNGTLIHIQRISKSTLNTYLSYHKTKTPQLKIHKTDKNKNEL